MKKNDNTSAATINKEKDKLISYLQQDNKYTKNTFAKQMLIKKKQEKLNSKKRFSINDWGIDKTNYVFISFEVVNFSKISTYRLIILKVVQGKIIKNYQSLINPYPSQLVANVDNQKINLVLDFARLWTEEIINFFNENSVIITHNANFDLNILRTLITRYNLVCPNFFYICSANLFKKTYNYTNNSLNALAHNNQIKFNHYHPLANIIILQKLINLHFGKQYHLLTLCSSLNIKIGRLFNENLL